MTTKLYKLDGQPGLRSGVHSDYCMQRKPSNPTQFSSSRLALPHTLVRNTPSVSLSFERMLPGEISMVNDTEETRHKPRRANPPGQERIDAPKECCTKDSPEGLQGDGKLFRGVADGIGCLAGGRVGLSWV